MKTLPTLLIFLLIGVIAYLLIKKKNNIVVVFDNGVHPLEVNKFIYDLEMNNKKTLTSNI